MRLRSITILAALATIPASLPAVAQGFQARHSQGGHARHGARGPHGAYGGSYPWVAYGSGFAEPFINGDYIDTPFTTIPRPNHLVPTPWSYGTYGVPTVSGIAPAPTGQPTLTVIHAQGARRGGGRAASLPDEGLDDMRVVNVSVPRR